MLGLTLDTLITSIGLAPLSTRCDNDAIQVNCPSMYIHLVRKHLVRDSRASEHFREVSLQLLVEKFVQYLHGNPAEHRRVVLDKGRLRQYGNQFHVFPPDRLRSDFFHYLEEQCTAAAADNQPVVVLMFSHGHPKKFGFTCGGDKRQPDCPRILLQ